MALKAKYIWSNGKFIPFKEAKIHIINHSLHYGSAVFEGIRCYQTPKGPAVFRLKEHIDRLFHSADVMGFKVPFSKGKIIKITKELVRKNNLKECYIRPIIYYSEKMGLLPNDASINIAIAAWPWGKYLHKDSISVKVSSFARIHPKSSVMTAKISGHYANSVMTALEAKKAGFDEALLLDWKGDIAEGPGENIFFVRKKILYTPKKGTILPGITRESIMKIAHGLGHRTIGRNIKVKDLKSFNEAFFVGTAVEVNAIGKIDKIIFGKGEEGKITKEIKEAYLDTVRGKIKKYNKWLNYVE
ncbi:branched-chain-amino-acid aminotransferase [bacterium BMS3Abin15]|nr:branched-chain-amino-acid aminotransferase [bacterium BMS3Abin15]HDZ85657.1 branched-chain amino acid transaminase [Candidatus Moranbacteria bacterium]